MSILKWVGGKKQLLNRLDEHLPDSVNNFYEPFGGSLTVTMHILERYPNVQNVYVADINSRLINMYLQLKKNPDRFVEALEIILELNENYNAVRERFNSTKNMFEQGVLMFYLNKKCFNGIYRVNKSGGFNVPEGKNSVDWENQKNNLRRFAEVLQDPRIHIINADYRKFFEQHNPKPGDLVYVDPPYWDTFTSYDGSGFDEADQRDLFDLCKSLDCCVIASNSDKDFIRELYGGHFTIHEVSVRRSVNRNATDRRGTEVIMLKNV